MRKARVGPRAPCSWASPKSPRACWTQCENHQLGWDPTRSPSSQEPVIQRQLTSEALNSAQMLEVCVLRLGGGDEEHSKGESSFFLLPRGGTRNEMHPEVA